MRRSRFAAALLCLLLAGARPASAMEFEIGASRSGVKLLLMQGRIVQGDAARFRAALTKSGQVAGLVLNSPGGSVMEAKDMARLIRTSKAAVMVPANAVCASACFMLFAASPRKLVELGAMVGVHSASVAGGNETMDTLGVTTLMAREVAGYGVPAAITGRMVTTRPGQMAWLSEDELKLMGARVAEQQAAPATRIAPGSPGGTPSDWTKGFEYGRTRGQRGSCSPPPDIADPANWTLGCESGRRSETAAVAGPRPAPSREPSEWSKGFDYGSERGGSAVCTAAPPGSPNARDWMRGCESGRKSASF